MVGDEFKEEAAEFLARRRDATRPWHRTPQDRGRGRGGSVNEMSNR